MSLSDRNCAGARVEGIGENGRWKLFEAGGRYLLVGSDRRYVELTRVAASALRHARPGVSPSAIALRLRTTYGLRVCASHVEEILKRVPAQLRALEEREDTLPFGFWARHTIFGEETVRRIAARVAVAFRYPVAGALVACIPFGLWRAAFHVGGEWMTPANVAVGLTSADLLCAYGLFLCSMVAHEFGHAAACSRYGAKPIEIGATMYWAFPALYSNVSDAWRLARRERIVVDVGGVYLQSVCASVAIFCYDATGWMPLLYGSVMMYMVCVVALTPFGTVLKFDGYWILSDALDVRNLGRQPIRLLGHARDLIAGRPTEPLPWSRGVVVALALYTVLYVAVWGTFMVGVLPRLVMDYLVPMPFVAFEMLTGSVPPPRGGAGTGVASLMYGVVALVAVVRIAGRMARVSRRWLRRRTAGGGGA